MGEEGKQDRCVEQIECFEDCFKIQPYRCFAGAVGKCSKMSKSVALPNMAQGSRGGLLFSLQSADSEAAQDASNETQDSALARDTRPKMPSVSASLPHLKPLDLQPTDADPSPGGSTNFGKRILRQLTGRSPKAPSPSQQPGVPINPITSPEAPGVKNNDTDHDQTDQVAVATSSPLPSDSPMGLISRLSPNSGPVNVADMPPSDDSQAPCNTTESPVIKAMNSCEDVHAAEDEDFKDAESVTYEDCRSSLVFEAASEAEPVQPSAEEQQLATEPSIEHPEVGKEKGIALSASFYTKYTI